MRKVVGVDGQFKIQMRIDMGVLQLEYHGRPDGQRPGGAESVLALHRDRLHEHAQRCGTVFGFSLTPDACGDLRDEVKLHYQRLLCLFVLEEYDQVISDISHADAVVEFCKQYGAQQDDRTVLLSFRPYLILMRAKASAARWLELEDSEAALADVNRGLHELQKYYCRHGTLGEYHRADEVKTLEKLRIQISGKAPADDRTHLRRALRLAVKEERFEDAARLRDQLGLDRPIP